MEAEVTILVDYYNADFLKSLTHSAAASPLKKHLVCPESTQ